MKAIPIDNNAAKDTDKFLYSKILMVRCVISFLSKYLFFTTRAQFIYNSRPDMNKIRLKIITAVIVSPYPLRTAVENGTRQIKARNNVFIHQIL
jgi:hypothetical protein